jgi:hypothetical protein
MLLPEALREAFCYSGIRARVQAQADSREDLEGRALGQALVEPLTNALFEESRLGVGPVPQGLILGYDRAFPSEYPPDQLEGE